MIRYSVIVSDAQHRAIAKRAKAMKQHPEDVLAQAFAHAVNAATTPATTKREATIAYIATHGNHDHQEPERMMDVADPHEERFVLLGGLYAITYETDKEGKVELWEHKFGKPRPALAFSPQTSRLVIAGGKYRVTPRGIEG